MIRYPVFKFSSHDTPIAVWVDRLFCGTSFAVELNDPGWDKQQIMEAFDAVLITKGLYAKWETPEDRRVVNPDGVIEYDSSWLYGTIIAERKDCTDELCHVSG